MNLSAKFSARLRRGFTLIELLIVIVIIGILAVGLVPKVIDAPKRARDVTRKADLNNIRAALTSYAADNNGNYPSPVNGVCVSSITNSIKQYFSGSIVPIDPISTRTTDKCANGSYVYNSLSNNATGVKCFVLGAQMEVSGSGNGNQPFQQVWDNNFCGANYQNMGNGPKDNFYIVVNY